jgi:O-antigen/teichoic acid export membrane protein
MTATDHEHTALTHAAAVRKSFLSLGLGETVARAIAFGAMVYVARTLGAGAYGVVALAGAVLLYFSYLGDLGIEAIGVAEVARDAARARVTVPALITARTVAGALLAVALAVVGLALLPQPEGAVLALYGLTLPVRGVNARFALLGQSRAGAASLSRVAGEALSAGMILLLVHGTGDLAHVPLTQIAGDALAALVLLLALRPAITGAVVREAWTVARPVLRAAWPVVLNTMLALLVFNADLIILRFFRDASVVGWYAAAYTLIAFLANLGLTFGYAVMPQVARSAADLARASALVRDSLVFALALTLPMAVGGLFVAPDLVRLVFGDAYAASGLPMVILLWSVPVAWLRSVSQLSLVALGRQRAVLGVTAIGAVVTVVLDLALIPRFGMTGAAAVTVAAEVVRFVAMQVVLARAGIPTPPLPAWWRPVLGTATMAAVLVAVRAPAPALMALGAAAYAGALLATGAVRRGPGGFEVRL